MYTEHFAESRLKMLGKKKIGLRRETTAECARHLHPTVMGFLGPKSEFP